MSAPNQTLYAKNIFALFETAISHRLKYPKIRLQTTDGQTVVLKLAGSRSKYQGQVQLTDDRPFDVNTYFGRIDTNGTFHETSAVTPAVRSLLVRLASNPAETAAEYGKLTGNCCFCDLRLTDARSTAVGYGPICADHFGLPWGNDFRAPRDSENVNTACTEVDAHENIPTGQALEAHVIETLFAQAPAITPELLLNDPSTPFWAKDVIRVAVTKDPVDAFHVFALLAATFQARCGVSR